MTGDFFIHDLHKANKKKVIATMGRREDVLRDLFDDDDNAAWHIKAQRLQARRWRKIKHQQE